MPGGTGGLLPDLRHDPAEIRMAFGNPLFGGQGGNVAEMEGVDRHHPQEIEPFNRGGQHLQKGHGCLKSARMTGQGKEQGAGTAEQAGTDHPDGQDVEPPAAQQPFRNGAGEKAPSLGGDARAAQAGALFTWGDCLEQAGKNIAAHVVDQALAGDGVLLAFGGNGGKFRLDALTG